MIAMETTEEEKYRPFRKIPRLNRSMIITEKLDGTNALVYVPVDSVSTIRAGSRNRWLDVDDDNFGFAQWVQANEAALRRLGPGYHWGEWWGVGIQRGYGLSERRFSLFNTNRWSHSPDVPKCCRVVPILWEGDFNTTDIKEVLAMLASNGSVAAPGYRNPEGIIVYHTAANHTYKVTIEGDGAPKTAMQGILERTAV